MAAGVLTAPIGGVGAAVAAGAYAGAAAGYVIPAVLENHKASPREILVSAAIGAVTAGVLSSYSSYLAASSGELIGPYAGTIAATGAKIAPTCANAAEAAASFGTGPGQAVFWSGLGRNGAAQAAEYASKVGGVTLEQTAGVAGLPVYDGANAASVAAWRSASQSFARGASGDVRVLLGNSRIDSIWNEVELPALKLNPAVNSITRINPTTGDSTLIWSR